jgi:hypothetical protein
MDQELDISLDVLEAGNTSDFRRMINDTEWSWLLCYFGGDAEVDPPYVRSDGPLDLAVGLSSALRSLASGKDRGVDCALAIGEVRRVLHQFHQIPSIRHIGVGTAQYAQAVMRLAEHLGFETRGTLKKPRAIKASYILSSVDTSWCVVKNMAMSIADIPEHNNFVHTIIHNPQMGHFVTAEGSVKLGWENYSMGYRDTQYLVLQLNHRFNSGLNMSTDAFSLDVRRGPNKDTAATLIPSGLPRCEQLFREANISQYLPDNAIASLVSMALGLGVYTDWYYIRDHTDRMPEEMMPEPPTWLSVWKEETVR